MKTIHSRLTLAAAALLVSATAVVPAQGQWSTLHEQTFLPAKHNWSFRQNYGYADRLFNAFDYGHAILYETLLRRPDADPSYLEEHIYNRLTRRVLVRPPHVPLEESAVMVEYAKLVPEGKMMFEWAHLLHRQAYDIWADERIPIEEKDVRMANILRYYNSRPDIAFSNRPKSMDLMDGQYYSLAFRERYPRFNGLIWAYHWLQIGLYEPLLLGASADERQALAQATVARFRQMLQSPPESMPYLMPMTAAIAPTFAARYPEFAIIFDNLHMMHDVVSDILTSPEVPKSRKRAEIVRALNIFRDDTTEVTTVEEWRSMAVGMGVDNQGGPAVGFVAALPTPTVPRGMSMAGMDHSTLDHTAHAAPAAPGGADHAGHADAGASPMAGLMDHGRLQEIHQRMMEDPVIRERVATDPTLVRMMTEMEQAAAGGDAEREMHQAMDLILRLLADPQVQARIHSDPRLHEMWVEPALQEHLEMMRSMHGADTTGAGAEPAPSGAQPAPSAPPTPPRTPAPAPPRPAPPPPAPAPAPPPPHQH